MLECGVLARSPLHLVNSGIGKLTSLFVADVRQRALSYVGRDAISIVENSKEKLAASVRGTSTYTVSFERQGDVIAYGCSCPYFVDRLEGCKHLFALVLEARQGDFVREAASCARFVARAQALDSDASDAEAAPGDDADWIDAFDGDDDAEGDNPFPSSLASWAVRREQRALPWQDFVHRAGAREAPKPKLELVYFLVCSPEHDGRVIVGQRRASGPADAFSAAVSIEFEVLVHDQNRELYGSLLPLFRSRSGYYRSTPHDASLNSFTAPGILEKLAETGRCYVVPNELRRDRDSEWFHFESGQLAGTRSRKKHGLKYEKMLSWPTLTKDDGEPYRLTLELVDRTKSTRAKPKRVFGVEASLFRGSERHTLAEVRYVHPTGAMVLGERLVRCFPSDTSWVSALMAHGNPTPVSEADLPDFVDHVFGKKGVSALRLPEGYDVAESSAPPRPVLDVAPPSGKTAEARLLFDYEGQRVAAEMNAALVILDQRALRRNFDAERSAVELLKSLAFTGDILGNDERPHRRFGVVSIEARGLLSAIHALLAAGWLVQAEGKRYRSASSFDIQVESGIDWFEVKGNVKFDGGEVPFPKLLAAIKHQQTLVELGDGTYGLLPEEWLQRWGMLAQIAPDDGEKLRFSSRQIGLAQALLSALPEEETGAIGLRELHQRLDQFQELEPMAPPKGFHGVLRPYQELGLGWLVALGELGFGACLADDMGLGKTIQVLAYLLSQKTTRSKSRKPSLVVVPRSLISNWLEEAARFAPTLVFHCHFGGERGKPKESWKNPDVVVTTYGTLRLDIGLLSEVDFATVILDEAQAIKNASSATAKCAKLLRAERRIAMSGTPIENHLGELWSLFDFLNPGLLSELHGLRRALESARPTGQTLSLVRALVRPFVLRRTKAEVAKDLPERVEQTLLVNLEPQERELYDELLRHYQASLSKKLEQIGPGRATPHVLEALLRLRQAACHPGLIDRERATEGSAKLECLVERLRSLREEGHRALVFSQFTSLLAIVRERLTREGITFEYLDGKTRNRAERVARFQTDDSIGVFLISVKAGGVGLNLAAADYVFILDPWWNPAVEAQAIDRAHRIGQTRNVIAYRLLARDTVEERVALLQQQKRDLVADIMGDDASLSARLTRGDLEALLDLTGKDSSSSQE